VPLELFNTLTGKVEPLYAADDRALRFYCCGPTVYDYGHIGNFRTFLHVDVLRRAARLFGLGLHHVMNITDVDDKIIRNAALAGKSIADFSRKFEQAFLEDMDALGIEHPEQIARATENIPESASRPKTLRTRPRTAAGTSASPAFRSTASSRRRISRASRTAPASTPTNTTRTARATSPSGRPQNLRMH
jgi:cysteinyl-tRNA synthetase